MINPNSLECDIFYVTFFMIDKTAIKRHAVGSILYSTKYKEDLSKNTLVRRFKKIIHFMQIIQKYIKTNAIFS